MRRVPERAGESRQRGAVLVELALVLPLFVALLLTVVDLGLVLREYQVVQNAVREGARYSIHQAPVVPETEVRARVVSYLQHEGIMDVTIAQVAVNQRFPIVTPAGLTQYGSQVTVTYTRNLLVPGGGFLPFANVTLSASTVFRNLS